MAGPFDDVFEELYRRYYDRVVSFLIAFGFPRERARDLAQDVFVRVYRGMEDYRSDAKWAYLETTTRRVALNALRGDNTAKHKGETVPVESAPIPDQHDDPERAAARNEERRRLEEGIEALSPRLQETLRLYLAGCSYREIEQILGISEDAVKTRLHEARVRLREILGEAPE